MSRINDEYDGDKPLVDNLVRFDSLTEKISEEIETLKEYVEVLNEYKAKMGTSEDTKSMRARMNNEISEGNELIKRTLELFQELEELKFKKKKDIDNFNKMVRRLNNMFNEDYEKFTKILKDIHSKERIFVQVRQASIGNVNNSFSEYSSTVISTGDQNANQENNYVYRGNGSGVIHSGNGSFVKQYNPPEYDGQHSEQIHDHSAHESVVEVMSDLDFYASVIREREDQVKHVRELAAEMNMFAQAQAYKIEEQQGDLENLVEYTNAAEDHTVQANKELDQALKYQKKATKRNLCLTVLIIVVCVVVAIIVFSLTS